MLRSILAPVAPPFPGRNGLGKALYSLVLAMSCASPVLAQDDLVGRWLYVKASQVDLKAGEKVVGTIPGDRWLQIESVQGAYFRVTYRDPKGASAQGWIQRDQVLVERALTNGDWQQQKKSVELETQGNALAAAGKYAEAKANFDEVLRIRLGAFGEKHPVVAGARTALGHTLYRMGKQAEAEQQYQGSLRIRQETLGDHPQTASSLQRLAELNVQMGRYVEAEPYYLRCLSIREAIHGRDHPDDVVLLNDMAVLYGRMGRNADGEPLLRRALEICDTKLGSDNLLTARTLCTFTNIYHPMGRHSELEPLLKRGLAIYEAKGGKDDLLLALHFHSLALLYHATGRYAEAEPMYLRSLAIREAKQGKDHPHSAVTLALLGHLYQDMRRYREAEPILRRSVDMQEARVGKYHPETAHNLRLQAFLYHAMGRNDEAEPLFRRCLEIRSKSNPDTPIVALSFNSLGMVYAATGRTVEARKEFDQARRVSQKYVSQVLPSLRQEQQRAFLVRMAGSHCEPASHCEDNLRDALSFAYGARSDAAVAETSAGWLANSKGQQHEAQALAAQLQSVDDLQARPIVQQLRQARQTLIRRKQEPAQAGRETEHKRQVEQLEQQERDLTLQLQRLGGRTGRGRDWIELSTIKAAIPAQGVLIDFARFQVWDFQSRRLGAARYVAWVTPPRGAVRIVDLGEAGAIDNLVSDVQKELASAPQSIKQDGESEAEKSLWRKSRALSRRVLDPLLAIDDVRKAGHWVLSPDGNLWLAPWAALPLSDDQDNGQYVVEKYVVRMVTAARETPHAAAGINLKTSLPLIVADPDFDLSRDDASRVSRRLMGAAAEEQALSRVSEGLRLGGINRLPATAAEAQLIAPRIEQLTNESPRVHVRDQALEAVVKGARRPRTLVLSTHGFFLPEQDVRLGGHSAGPADENGPRAVAIPMDAKFFEDPLLRCGLLLAACNDQPKAGQTRPGDDGVLTGAEVVGLDLRGCELVVLSACDTGLGEVRNGEGVAGLRQAFQLAGAESVLASLWSVPDAETARLMVGFFDHLASGEERSESLGKIQRELIQKRRDRNGAAHPFFWAAFTMTGQDRTNR